MITLLLGGLTWWSSHIEDSKKVRVSELPQGQELNRRLDLVEALDRVVTYEHYYHSVYGHFTKLLYRIGYSPPHHVSDYYDVRVAEASRDRLLVTAVSEEDGRGLEIISVDQDYQVHANFALPAPRADYLKVKAMKHLRALASLPKFQAVTEQGVFKEYFQYVTQGDSKGQKVVSALGIRAPVLGMRLELSDSDPGRFEASEHLSQFGQMSSLNSSNLGQEAYLAQKIYLGETGRYASSWLELSQMVHFQFEGRDQFGAEPMELVRNLAGEHHLAQKEKSHSISHTSEKALEIEAISPTDP